MTPTEALNLANAATMRWSARRTPGTFPVAGAVVNEDTALVHVPALPGCVGTGVFDLACETGWRLYRAGVGAMILGLRVVLLTAEYAATVSSLSHQPHRSQCPKSELRLTGWSAGLLW